MAPLLRLCLLCLPLLLPPPAATAPAPRTDWAACGSLSRELSRLLATLKEPHPVLEQTQLSEADPENWPPRIRCSDACDPSTLDTNNTRCLRRILQGLQHYRDLLGSDIFTARRLLPLEATLDRLLGLVQVRGRGPGSLGPPTPLSPQQEHGRAPRHPAAPSNTWTHALLRRLALQRLQSFVTIMSRVFTHSAR
ncbi:IL23A protein, partial [Ardeotis kori]|nr:IL23A protein [Ardeotis kori]